MADAPAIPRVHFNIALRIPRHAGVTAGQLLSSLPLGWLRRSVMEPTQQRAYSCWASRTILGTLGDYIGKYRLDFRAVFDFALKGDHLEAQLIGPPTIPIFASAKGQVHLQGGRRATRLRTRHERKGRCGDSAPKRTLHASAPHDDPGSWGAISVAHCAIAACNRVTPPKFERCNALALLRLRRIVPGRKRNFTGGGSGHEY